MLCYLSNKSSSLAPHVALFIAANWFVSKWQIGSKAKAAKEMPQCTTENTEEIPLS